jgi:hypothetical protein
MMLPELLGRNLAAESWGVGNVYREMTDSYRTLGFDATLSLSATSIRRPQAMPTRTLGACWRCSP